MTRIALPCLLLLAALAGCGSSPGSGTRADHASPSPSFGATYGLLSQDELDAALLGLDDVPVGYSQDPPSHDTANSSFCGQKAATPDVKASRDFTRGGGLSTQVIDLAISQYRSDREAQDVFASVSKLFETCHGEMFQGRKLTYALMSVPKAGDESFGLRITAGRNITYVANYALVGPVVVTTIGGGYFTVNTDQISTLFTKQVSSYQDAAN